MKLFLKDAFAGIIMGLILPGMMLNFAALLLKQPASEAVDAQEDTVIDVPVPAKVTQTESVPLRIAFLKSDGKTEEADMDDYLVGVVLAEMPAWFEAEALKAQAVVARTYTLKARVTGGKHGGGSVCTQSGCCQAYISEADFLQKGGTIKDIEKVRAAVVQTSDLVLVYDGDLIEATYFSCSGGSTEDAVAVWGTVYPYLQAVESPGEEEAKWYTDTVIFPKEQFCRLLGIPGEDPGGWFGEVTYTDGGGVENIVIGGQAYAGTQLRSLLGLRSTAFEITPSEDHIVIATKGYGHRVGMSQYGAEAMAVKGSNYREILAHYYPGTELVTMIPD